MKKILLVGLSLIILSGFSCGKKPLGPDMFTLAGELHFHPAQGILCSDFSVVNGDKRYFVTGDEVTLYTFSGKRVRVSGSEVLQDCFLAVYVVTEIEEIK